MPIAIILSDVLSEMTCGGDAAPSVMGVAAFIAAVLTVAFLMTASQNRRTEQAESLPRLCRSCALSHPPFANYCRRCGRRL